MSGVDVTKSVKQLRPDIDVVIITGYATVETAVECMKFGAMDYVQKPFTEDELLEFVKKILIKRKDRIQKQLKPKVHISHLSKSKHFLTYEFAIPGGVFISAGHSWLSIGQDGAAKIGIDDFAKKLIGKIDSIEFPNLGMAVKKGQSLFTVIQGTRSVTFSSPVSGKVTRINTVLKSDLEVLDISSYNSNWICIIDADDIDSELKDLTIGKTAVTFYENDLDRFIELRNKSVKPKDDAPRPETELYIGEFEKMDNAEWDKMATEFFKR